MSPATKVTPSIVCKPESVIFPVVPACAGCFQLIPKATVSTYNLLAISVEPTGVEKIVPVVVAILVKTPVEGVVAPIVVLLIVLFVIVALLTLPLTGTVNGCP